MRIVEATEIVLDLATQQWGLVTTAQAKAAGVVPVMLTRLVDKAVLTRIRSGVYAAEATAWSPATEVRAQWLALEPGSMAADRLTTAPGAVVSYESAAELRRIGDLDSHSIHFTVPTRRQTRQPDVVFHIDALDQEDWSVLDGLPVTTPLRTVTDLARAGHEPDHLVDMIGTILQQRLSPREDVINTLTGIAHELGITPATQSGVGDWLDERFPAPESSPDDIVQRSIDKALTPIQAQLQEILDTITLPQVRDIGALPDLGVQSHRLFNVGSSLHELNAAAAEQIMNQPGIQEAIRQATTNSLPDLDKLWADLNDDEDDHDDSATNETSDRDDNRDE